MCPKQLTEFYDVDHAGPATHPAFGPNWRPRPVPLKKGDQFKGGDTWATDTSLPKGDYAVIGKHAGAWRVVRSASHPGGKPFSIGISWLKGALDSPSKAVVQSDGAETLSYDAIELLLDRRPDLAKPHAK